MRRLAWAADSSHVIVSAPDRPGHGEGLLLVSITDGARVWSTDPKAQMIWGDREPAVSQDGRWIAFARGEEGSSEAIHLLRLTDDLHPAGSPQPSSAAGRARSPAWSPDGKEILYMVLSPGMVGAGYVGFASKAARRAKASPPALLPACLSSRGPDNWHSPAFASRAVCGGKRSHRTAGRRSDRCG